MSKVTRIVRRDREAARAREGDGKGESERERAYGREFAEPGLRHLSAQFV